MDDIGKKAETVRSNQNYKSNGKSELTDKQLKRLYALAKVAQVPPEEAKRTYGDHVRYNQLQAADQGTV